MFQHGEGQRGISETLLGAFESSQTGFVIEEGKIKNNGDCHGLLCSHFPCFHCLQHHCESCKFKYSTLQIDVLFFKLKNYFCFFFLVTCMEIYAAIFFFLYICNSYFLNKFQVWNLNSIIYMY